MSMNTYNILHEKCTKEIKHKGQCCNVKGKGVPLHAMVAHGGRGGIAPTHT
jgi:hypothetical protein